MGYVWVREVKQARGELSRQGNAFSDLRDVQKDPVTCAKWQYMPLQVEAYARGNQCGLEQHYRAKHPGERIEALRGKSLTNLGSTE